MNKHISTIRTPWTAIQRGEPNARARCLAEIAERYYAPVRSYVGALPGVRHPEVADDLAQRFFHKFLEHELLTRLDQNAGQFRQFLKTAVRNYVKDEFNRAGHDNPNSPLARHHPLPAGEITISGR